MERTPRDIETELLVLEAQDGTLSFLAVGSLKLWFWMQMDKYSVLREIKRLELQVALLVQKQ